MKPLFTKIGRLFRLTDFLKCVIGIVALVVLFYAEEDWRGAHAWAVTKAKWEAKGESFDLNHFIPPPIPDNQNLAAIPLFKLEPDPKTDNQLEPLAVDRAVRSDLPAIDYHFMGNWMKGEPPDIKKIQNFIATNYATAFKNAKPPGDTLSQFDATYPFLADIMAAAKVRPLCRFNVNYTIFPPVERPLGLIVAPIKLSKLLTLHAILALEQHQPDLAEEDFKLNYRLLSAAGRDPSLVGGLVAIGMAAIGNDALYNGLAQHAWSDAQLTELEATLRPVDFLADYQFAMRSEAASWVANLDWYEKIADRSHRLSRILNWNGPPWPDGWWDQNKSKMTEFHLQDLKIVDPRSRLVFPNVALDLQHQVEQAKIRWDAMAPWNILANVAAGPMTNAAQKFGQAQTWLNEARIACALERYWLAHGSYPESLDALAPTYIDDLPHDIMNGEPYHYRLRPDGTFLLYSVGWNQTDEDGKIVLKKNDPYQIDYEQGDWVWPTPK
jgi:hypothetical protein